MFSKGKVRDYLKMILTSISIFGMVFMFFAPMKVRAASSNYVSLYRLYNAASGEHFYTSNSFERDNLNSIGWRYEGIGWYAPATSDTPVYRLYNPNSGDHHFTISSTERSSCVQAGWRYEGIGWYSDDRRSVPVYREYNPNASAGTHNYTLDKTEHNNLVRAGWRDENIGWYGVIVPDSVNWGSIEKSYKNFLDNSTLWFERMLESGSAHAVEDLTRYDIVDINGDDIPELVVLDFGGAHMAGYQAIYTYYNGAVQYVSAFQDFDYYLGGGLRSGWMNMGNFSDYYSIFDGKTVTEICYDNGTVRQEELVYYDGKNNEISESEFMRLKQSVTRGKEPLKFNWRYYSR